MATAMEVQQNVSKVLTAYNKALAEAGTFEKGQLAVMKNSIDAWKQSAYDAMANGTIPAGNWGQWTNIGNTILYQLSNFTDIESVGTLRRIADAIVNVPRQAASDIPKAARTVKQAAIDVAKGAGEVTQAATMPLLKPIGIAAAIAGGVLLIFGWSKKQGKR